MPKPPLPDDARRDKPLTAMVTTDERARVDRFAEAHGMSRSNAARLLIMRGLASTPSPPIEGAQT